MTGRWQTEAVRLFAELGRLTLLREEIDGQIGRAKDGIKALNATLPLLDKPPVEAKDE